MGPGAGQAASRPGFTYWIHAPASCAGFTCRLHVPASCAGSKPTAVLVTQDFAPQSPGRFPPSDSGRPSEASRRTLADRSEPRRTANCSSRPRDEGS